MTSLYLLTAVLLSQPAPEVKLAAPGLSCTGIEAGICDSYLERFATMLGRTGVKVTTSSDLARMLGFERQKQLMGCDDGTSCIAELAGGLGIDAMLGGSLAKTEAGYTVTFRVIRARDGRLVATASERRPDAASLEAWLDEEAPRLALQVKLAFGLQPAEAYVEPMDPTVRWIPAMVGGAMLLAGVTTFAVGKSDAIALRGGGLTREQIDFAAARGATLQPAGLVLIGGGAVLAASSVLWVALASGDAPVAVVPLRDGAAVSFGGSF